MDELFIIFDVHFCGISIREVYLRYKIASDIGDFQIYKSWEVITWIGKSSIHSIS